MTTTSGRLLCGKSYASVDKPKGSWVVITLSLTNLGKENFALNNWNVELRDDKGVMYNLAGFDSLSCSDGKGQAHLGDQMPPGVAVRTTLLFDVAPGTGGKVLVLTQGGGRITLE